MPAIRRRASSMSARVGPVVVANSKHLLHDLADSGQRVQFAALYLVQQPPQLGIVRDGVLQMRLRPRGRDGEDLAGQVAPAPRIQLVVLLEEASVRLDLRP